MSHMTTGPSGPRQGILCAAYGAGSAQAEAAFRCFEGLVRERFPGIPVRWAFTSLRMRERLASERIKSDSVRKALMRMHFERIQQVALQPLHVIPGLEYGEIAQEINLIREEGLFSSLSLGAPLLDFPATGIPAVAEILAAAVSGTLGPGEGVLFVGHGSRHPSTILYERLAYALRERDARLFLGTLSGTLSLSGLEPELRAQGINTVRLLPLLSIVGRHTLEDLAGDGPESWKNRLRDGGFACHPEFRGLMEYDGLLRIWLERLAGAMEPVF